MLHSARLRVVCRYVGIVSYDYFSPPKYNPIPGIWKKPFDFGADKKLPDTRLAGRNTTCASEYSPVSSFRFLLVLLLKVVTRFHFDSAVDGGQAQPCEAAFLFSLDPHRGGTPMPPEVIIALALYAKFYWCCVITMITDWFS